MAAMPKARENVKNVRRVSLKALTARRAAFRAQQASTRVSLARTAAYRVLPAAFSLALALPSVPAAPRVVLASGGADAEIRTQAVA